jgi:hypothetical protein
MPPPVIDESSEELFNPTDETESNEPMHLDEDDEDDDDMDFEPATEGDDNDNEDEDDSNEQPDTNEGLIEEQGRLHDRVCHPPSQQTDPA